MSQWETEGDVGGTVTSEMTHAAHAGKSRLAVAMWISNTGSVLCAIWISRSFRAAGYNSDVTMIYQGFDPSGPNRGVAVNNGALNVQ